MVFYDDIAISARVIRNYTLDKKNESALRKAEDLEKLLAEHAVQEVKAIPADPTPMNLANHILDLVFLGRLADVPDVLTRFKAAIHPLAVAEVQKRDPALAKGA